jgi:endogenous inhibitor of DNA gyrase (YacG/DUF329 family)
MKCNICEKEFKNINTYNAHITWHKNNDQFPDGVNCPLCNYHAKSIKGLYRHSTISHTSEQEKIAIYRHLNKDETIYVCENCGKEAVFSSVQKGFERFCSEECRDILNKRNHKKAMEDVDYSKVDFDTRNQKSKKTCLDKYGVDNPLKAKEIKEKIKQTNLERLGVEYPCQSKTVVEKRIATNNEKYGCDHGLSSKDVIQKRINTLQESYGVDNVFQLS